jgi:hypothetical protein
MRGTHDGNIRIGPGQFGIAVNLMGWVTGGDLADDQPFVGIRASTFQGIAQKTRITVTVVDTLT